MNWWLTGAVLAAWPAVMGLTVLGTRIVAARRDPRTYWPVVVDRRTYRNASRAANKLIAMDEPVRAHAAVMLIMKWLGGEITAGPKWRREEYEHALLHWQGRDQPLREQLGLPSE